MTHVPVPESGGGSGSSTATFGDGLGLIFNALPASQLDTSAASESGADIVTGPVRRPRPRREPGTSLGSRSPIRPSRHGSASGSRSSVSPGQGGAPKSRGRSRFEMASNELTSSRGQDGSSRREGGGRGGSSGYADGSPSLQQVSAGSPFIPTMIDSPSFPPTLLYSPSIAPTVVRSPFAPTIVQSPASVVPLLVRSPFASTMVQSPASIAPWPARSPFVASVSQSPRRSEHVGTPSFELRSRMDASGSPSKRTLDIGSVQSPSLVKPRRMASAPRYMEPLSHLPEHASPSEAQPLGPLSTLPVEVLNLQREAAPESRVSMSMTLQEYQRLMQALSTELSAARSLGRDEGTSAMEVVAHRLSDHMGRMCIKKVKDFTIGACRWNPPCRPRLIKPQHGTTSS